MASNSNVPESLRDNEDLCFQLSSDGIDSKPKRTRRNKAFVVCTDSTVYDMLGCRRVQGTVFEFDTRREAVTLLKRIGGALLIEDTWDLPQNL